MNKQLHEMTGTKHDPELFESFIEFFSARPLAIEMYQDWMAEQRSELEHKEAANG